MRLILSRKGFDSQAGGAPSPIFEDGTMFSLPIPEKGSPRTYAEVTLAGRPLGPLVESLSRGKTRADFGVHLDPDLTSEAVPRRPGWRPSLGQCDAAQGVLRRAGVGEGDVFLFFGWFREVEERANGPTYLRGAPDLHVLFGWLQVGSVIRPPEDPPPVWAFDHPHVVHPHRSGNSIYLASEGLSLPGEQVDAPGAGTFRTYREDLRLTAPDSTRSVWELPRWFDPRSGRPPLGAHGDLGRWYQEDGDLRLRSVARGQEFVLEVDHYPEAIAWIRELIA